VGVFPRSHSSKSLLRKKEREACPASVVATRSCRDVMAAFLPEQLRGGSSPPPAVENSSPIDPFEPRPAKRRRLSPADTHLSPRLERSPPAQAAEAASAVPDRPAVAAPPAAAAKPKRVRTGCLTCRERHLKCDEAAPDCLNCRKSNRECKRGVRLNFIDVQVRSPPYVPPAVEWSGSWAPLPLLGPQSRLSTYDTAPFQGSIANQNRHLIRPQSISRTSLG
jgi:hypothetical protein